MTKIRPYQGRGVSDAKIKSIMQEHQGFRKALAEYRPEIPLMSDEEFLRRLYEIVPPGFGVVTGHQAAAIYRLRAEYEKIPPGIGGHVSKYNGETVRLQVRAKTLNPLSRDQLRQVFGVERTQENWYWLDKVLERPLGRWPASRRNLTREEVLSWWRDEKKEKEDAAS
jgi:hypothetical protein